MAKAYRILVVDDNATNRHILVKSLSQIGYEVQEARDGFEAVDIATAQVPDLILLDIMMPGRDGFEVGRILQSQPVTASIPFIFLTAKSDAEDIDRAFSLGGCDYLIKPFKMSEVKARISVHLQLRHAQKETEERNKQLEEMSKVIAETNIELARQARIDSLTTLLNRRAWEESVTMEHDRCRRNGDRYSIFMIDVDYFKSYNDSLGHQAGDDCLRHVATCIQSSCRTMDAVGRYGGEEFVVLVPQKISDSSQVLAERIRKAVYDLNIPHPASLVADRVTVSVGIADLDENSWEDVLEKADTAMYIAKETGRNKVCTFNQTMPNKDARNITPQGPTAIGTTAQQHDQGRFRVLIVDDHATNRAVCRQSLEHEGYEIREAIDGITALDEISRMPPHVILMDVMMPGMDGLTCTRHLKENPNTQYIPVIMVSALADASDIRAGLEAGADEYLTKPIRPAELAMRVQSMIKRECARQDLLNSNHIRGEQTRILNLLLDLCRTLGATEELDKVLEFTIRETASLTGCRRISIMLPNIHRTCLCIEKSIGVDDPLSPSMRIPAGPSIAWRVFESGIRHVINDEHTVADTKLEEDALHFISTPFICTALGTTEHVVGVINIVDRIDKSPFLPRDLEAVEMIASIAVTAISGILARRSRDVTRDAIMVAFAKLAEKRDGDMINHVDRLTQYCLILAGELRKSQLYSNKIDDQFMYNLERAVPLHDIGKIAIPDKILLKPGRLTAQEMAIMKTHAEIGADTIRTILDRAPALPMLKMAEVIASSHHEWFDGTGYPQGLKAAEIPLVGRIVALADAYDAIISKRPYKEAIDHDQAVTIILKSSGTQFDSAVVEAFMRHESQFKTISEELTDNPPSTPNTDENGDNLVDLTPTTCSAGMK